MLAITPSKDKITTRPKLSIYPRKMFFNKQANYLVGEQVQFYPIFWRTYFGIRIGIMLTFIDENPLLLI